MNKDGNTMAAPEVLQMIVNHRKQHKYLYSTSSFGHKQHKTKLASLW